MNLTATSCRGCNTVASENANSLVMNLTNCQTIQYNFNNLWGTQNDKRMSCNRHNFIALLKACMKSNDLKQGLKIHDVISRSGIPETDLFVGSSLVEMYGKFGLLNKARYQFSLLPVHDVVAWTSLTKGYAEHGCATEALECFEFMQNEGVLPDATSFVCCLQACNDPGYIMKGIEIHAKVTFMGLLEKEAYVGSSLVNMYVKCGSLAKAQKAFDRIPFKNIVTWTALITGYSEYGNDEEALAYFGQMEKEGVSPDVLTYVLALKICGKMSAIEKGKKIHADVERLGLRHKNLDIVHALIEMYAKFGMLERAQKIFDDLENPNVDSWNTLIAGYSEQGNYRKAMECYGQMKLEGISPSSATFVCALKSSSITGAIDKAQEICTEAQCLETDVFLGSSLIHFYANYGFLTEARNVFDNLGDRNVVAWNAFLAGYAEHGDGKQLLRYYAQMEIEGVHPDVTTYVCMLKACASVGTIDMGHRVHAEVEKKGLLDRELLGNTLIDMYGKSGSLVEACNMFDRIPVRNVVSWTAMLAGHADHGKGEKAIQCFQQMKLEGVTPDVFTYIHTLKACGRLGAKDKGKEIHAEIERQDQVHENLLVTNILVDMYAKCGLLSQAQQLLDLLPFRDIVSWNALITGYTEYGQGEEAVKCFQKMQREGIAPDIVTLDCVLKSCPSIGASVIGQQIHAEIERRGLLEGDLFVGSTLVDMYAKCGSLDKAQEVFKKLLIRDSVAWNALMAGYAQTGQIRNVFDTFDRMREDHTKPDSVTFLVLLGTCRSAGMLNESFKYFDAMNEKYGIAPSVEHYVCVVDLLSRAGQLDEAVATINRMPFPPNITIWHALLDSCRSWGSLELAKQAFGFATHLDQENAVAYVLLSHIYAGNGDNTT